MGKNIARPDNGGRYTKILLSVQYSNQFLSVLGKHLVIVNTVCSVFFFQLFIGHHLSANSCLTPVSFVKTTESYGFHWSSLIGKPRMTPVTSVKTTEAYAVCQ